MASYNKVILIGNLTRDPEMRTTPSGTSVAKIGLAVNRTYKTSDGKAVDETTFIDVDAFGKQAEVLAQYMSKGRPLMVEGRLKFDTWEKDGEKRSKLGVILESFQFIGGREADSDPSGTSRQQSSSRPPSEDDGFDDDDVPF